MNLERKIYLKNMRGFYTVYAVLAISFLMPEFALADLSGSTYDFTPATNTLDSFNNFVKSGGVKTVNVIGLPVLGAAALGGAMKPFWTVGGLLTIFNIAAHFMPS